MNDNFPAEMTTAAQVIRLIAQRIGYIYERPLMYGGTAEGVETVLSTLHSLWADATGHTEQFSSAVFAIASKNGSDAASFSSHYVRNHPHATEHEVAAHVVSLWKRISNKLGIEGLSLT
jgi:hypothetical protein